MQSFLLDTLFGLLFSGFGSIFALIHLVLAIMALYSIWNDDSMEGTAKLLWSGAIFFFPLVGLILWWLFGKDDKK
ncbi:MAG: PLD nuclease N-terminal domain-containing protein [Bacteroidia bacterium]